MYITIRMTKVELRVHALKFVTTALVGLELAWILFPLRAQQQGKWTFWHFFSFAIHYGSQFWMTFIAGMAMFLTLPRFWFGEGQKLLFPMYFALSFVMSSMTLATYIQLHMDSGMEFKEVLSLSMAVFSSLVNSYYLSDRIVETTTKRFGLEKDSGTAYEIGFVDLSKLRENPEYFIADKTFRFYHHLSWLSNMTGFCANTIYLYFLSSHYL
ncbi:transmembrane protein 205-like [Mytilus edulis]